MHHANLEKLKSLRLFGMVRALQELTGLDDRGRLDFDDQLALLIERETADRAALEMRLKGIVTLTWIGREKTSKGRKSAFHAAFRTHVSCFQTSNALVR